MRGRDLDAGYAASKLDDHAASKLDDHAAPIGR
jgi:hypothetical protein